MQRSMFGVLTAAFMIAMPALASAQATGGRGSSSDSIPKSARPPAGMCRIWVAGVAANKQAAPTNCATAVRNVPPNGSVIWGDTSSKAKPKTIITGTKTAPPTVKTNPVKVIPPKIPPPNPSGSDTTLSTLLNWRPI